MTVPSLPGDHRGPFDDHFEAVAVALDFLWGRPTEILLRALTPDTFAFGTPTRIVHPSGSTASR